MLRPTGRFDPGACHDRRGAHAVITDGGTDGNGDLASAGASNRWRSTRLTKGSQKRAAQRPICRWSDEYVGDRRWSVPDHGAPSILGGEEEDGEVQEDDVLTPGACGCSAWSEEVGIDGNHARSSGGRRGRRRSSSRLEASRHDCLDEEAAGNEAELLPLADLLRESSVDGGERRRLV